MGRPIWPSQPELTGGRRRLGVSWTPSNSTFSSQPATQSGACLGRGDGRGLRGPSGLAQPAGGGSS